MKILPAKYIGYHFTNSPIKTFFKANGKIRPSLNVDEYVTICKRTNSEELNHLSKYKSIIANFAKANGIKIEIKKPLPLINKVEKDDVQIVISSVGSKEDPSKQLLVMPYKLNSKDNEGEPLIRKFLKDLDTYTFFAKKNGEMMAPIKPIPNKFKIKSEHLDVHAYLEDEALKTILQMKKKLTNFAKEEGVKISFIPYGSNQIITVKHGLFGRQDFKIFDIRHRKPEEDAETYIWKITKRAVYDIDLETIVKKTNTDFMRRKNVIQKANDDFMRSYEQEI